MSITGKLHIPEHDKNISFGDTVIKWDNQQLEFCYNHGQRYSHQLTEPQWNYLVSGLETLIKQIPNISDIEIPKFNEDIK